MMTEVNFSDLINAAKIAKDPQIAENAFSISKTLKDLNGSIDQLEGVMKLIDRIERSPALSTAIRMLAKDQKIEIKALKEDAPVSEKIIEVGVKPLTSTHNEMFQELNKIPEEQLKKMIEAMKEKNAEKS